MKKKLLFVYNPNAGKGRIKNWLSSIVELFVKHEFEVVIYSTSGKKDATNIVIDCLKKESYDRVICSGGDGTLNEVISGVMLSGVNTKIGYIPAGTTNDFAYNLKLPKNMQKAAWIALNGESYVCDIGNMNGEYFTYTAAFGLFTDASYETPQHIKNMLGKLAYLLEGIKRLPNWKSYVVKITYEDKVIKDDFILGLITNSTSVAGFKGLTSKDVLLDDGLFECLFIKRPQSVLDLQGIINDLLTGSLHGEHIYSFPIKEIELESEESIPWSLDGEFGGEYTHTVIKNNQKAITIYKGDGNKKQIPEV